MISIINNIVIVFILHFIGDYLFQPNKLSQQKSDKRFLLIHCCLYASPFLFYYRYDWRICILIVSHYLIDGYIRRHFHIGILADQSLHIGIAILLYTILYNI